MLSVSYIYTYTNLHMHICYMETLIHRCALPERFSVGFRIAYRNTPATSDVPRFVSSRPLGRTLWILFFDDTYIANFFFYTFLYSFFLTRVNFYFYSIIPFDFHGIVHLYVDFFGFFCNCMQLRSSLHFCSWKKERNFENCGLLIQSKFFVSFEVLWENLSLSIVNLPRFVPAVLQLYIFMCACVCISRKWLEQSRLQYSVRGTKCVVGVAARDSVSLCR